MKPTCFGRLSIISLYRCAVSRSVHLAGWVRLNDIRVNSMFEKPFSHLVKGQGLELPLHVIACKWKLFSPTDWLAAGLQAMAVLCWPPVWSQTQPTWESWICQEMTSKTLVSKTFLSSSQSHFVNWRHWSEYWGHNHTVNKSEEMLPCDTPVTHSGS